MSIQISIPTEALADRDVSAALRALLTALSGVALGVEVSPQATVRSMAAPVAPQRTQKSMTYTDFVAALPLRSQRFLDLVRSRGVVRVSEVVETMGLKSAKAVGGITGAIGRWGPERGVSLPYEAITLAGERAWRWIRLEDDTPALPEPSPRARAASVASGEQLPELLAALPEHPRRVMDIIRDTGSISLPDLLAALGLARAASLTEYLRAITDMAPKYGVVTPFVRTTSPTGESLFVWPGAEAQDLIALASTTRKDGLESAGTGVMRRRGRA